MPDLRAALVSLAVLLVATTARAETPEAQVERLAAEAVNAYRGADYNHAVELLQKAYEIRQVPALLYNMAKAYDKLGDTEHASDAYRRYVASLDADPKLKAKAEARLGQLEAERRKLKAAEQAAEQQSQPKTRPQPTEPRPQRIQPQVATPPPSPPGPSEAELIRDKLKRERQADRRRARWVALGMGITTVALGATGLGLSLSALSLQNQWASQYGGDEDTRRALKNSAVLRAGLADGFFALTAVSAAITSYFLYRGYRPEPTAPSLAWGVSPAGAYVAAEGRF